MSSLVAVVIPDQEKPSCYQTNEKASANEKAFDKWVPELKDEAQSFHSIMLMINRLMKDFAIMMRDLNMKFTENFIQQRVNEFTKAVSKIIESIKGIARVEITVGLLELATCLSIGIYQYKNIEKAHIAGSVRDAAVGMITHAGGAYLKQRPQIEGEIGRKEQTLTDVWQNIERNAREWFQEAARLFASLCEMMADITQKMQNILSVARQ